MDTVSRRGVITPNTNTFDEFLKFLDSGKLNNRTKSEEVS